MSQASAADGIDIDRKAALELVTEMMGIPGKSGQEGNVSRFVRERLAAAGIAASQIVHDTAHRRSPIGGEVGNLIVKLPGTVRGPRRLLMAHLDTVPLCVGSRPVRKGSFIVSRDPDTALGADDRAGTSAVLTALLEIKRQKLPHPPLTLFWPVQEEIGLVGARYASLAKLGRPKLCFNYDGGLPHLVTIGATGDDAIRIEVDGIASHAAAHPERGVSAIAIASLAISDLVRDGWHGRIVKGKQSGTSNVGVVHGGEATNVITPRLELRAEARSHNRKFRRRIVEAYRSAFERAARSLSNDGGRTGRIRFAHELRYEAFQLSEKEPVVQTALAAVRAAGLNPETRVVNGGLDANWMTAHGLPTVTFGCGQQDVHTVDESLHIDSYLASCRIALLLAAGIV